jgi:hypothetical protein
MSTETMSTSTETVAADGEADETDGADAPGAVDGETGADEPEAQPSRLRRITRWRPTPPTFLQWIALVPVASTLSLVLSSSKLQWFDYWSIFPRITNPDGSLAPRQLFKYHEGHILAVPSVVYWLNYKLTSGLNTSLGLFVVALALAQVWMLRRLLPSMNAIGRWVYAGLFVAIVALMFAPQGAHNFGRAMSGTAWLLANFFAVAAILLVTRGPLVPSIVLAVPLGVLATLSYGTGLMTWPALVFIIGMRTDWNRVFVVVSGVVGLAAMGVYFFYYDTPASQSSVGFDPNDIARRATQVLGSVLNPDPDGAVIAGVIAVVVALFAALVALQRDKVAATPWVALAIYSIMGAAMIGGARGGVNGDDIGTASRYYSLSALCWSAVLALLAVAWPRENRALVAAAVVGSFAFVGGHVSIDHVRTWNPGQDELAVAMRLDIADGYPFFYGNSKHIPMLRDVGHYPFSDDYDADCGLTGKTIDPDAKIGDFDRAKANLDGFITPYNKKSMRIQGWVVIPSETVKCVLVVDDTSKVVGAGAYGIKRPDLVQSGGSPNGDYDVGFRAVTPRGSDSYTVVVVTSDGQQVLLPGSADLGDPILET